MSSAGSASRFVLTGRIAASGNIQSLLDETCQRNDVPEYCYYSMFQGCSSLAQAPELPATTLAFGCYYSMFYNCDSLTQAPTLPATTLAVGCYSHMFFGCTNLTQAPELLATTLANSCYYNMFSSCTSLTQAPALPATTLASYCYYSMFSGCSRLKISENGNVGKKILDIPSGTTIYTNWNTNMFSNTAGTFKGDPQIGNSYWCY